VLLLFAQIQTHYVRLVSRVSFSLIISSFYELKAIERVEMNYLVLLRRLPLIRGRRIMLSAQKPTGWDLIVEKRM
jgi:hypothetical protein